MSIIEEINEEQRTRLATTNPIPEFAPGDTLRVNVRVVEGQRERVQAFEGVCIDVIRRGDVRRAKLYYLRGLTGKAARIAEKTDGYAAKLEAKNKQKLSETKKSTNKGGKDQSGGQKNEQTEKG